MSTIKGLIFDLDGTIIDTVPDLAKSVNYSLMKNNLPTREVKEITSFLGNGSRMLIKRAIGKEVEKDLENKVFDDYLSYYLKHVADSSLPFYGMKEVLITCKQRGIKLAVVTNKPDQAAKILVEKLFPSTFDYIIGNRKDIPTKPEPTSLNMALNELNLKPEEVAYFGDSDVDMILASNASIYYKVGVAWGYRPLAELIKYKPYKIIYRPSEILTLLD